MTIHKFAKLKNKYDLNFASKSALLKFFTIVGLAECLIMQTIIFLPKMPAALEIIINSLAVSTISSFAIWYWLIKPLRYIAEENLSQLHSLKSALQTHALFLSVDTNGLILSINKNLANLTGYELHELIGIDHKLIFLENNSENIFENKTYSITNGTAWHGEIKVRTKFNKYCYLDSTFIPIQNTQSKIIKYTFISYDITSRKKNELELIEARNLAEVATKTKMQFLANMSHEIRTPMNGIIGMSSLLLDSASDPRSIERLKIIQNCGNTLLDLINDVLDFSKLEVDRVEIEKHPFSIQTTTTEIITLFNTRASEKNIQISYQINVNDLDFVSGDVTRFKQVLMNLISNAVKFTENNGIIDINYTSIKKNDNKWEIKFSVKDSGIGIADSVKNKLFQSFSQVDASTTRKFGGTGLGLAISKGLCEKMGGNISVTSEVGVGSTFVFTFLVEEASEKSILESKQNTFKSVDQKMASSNPLKILVAEDNQVNQLVIVGLLQKLGYQPKIVSNGAEVLIELENNYYDLILMDCHMPVLDGFDASKKIIAKYSESDRPKIVALTASTMKDDIDRCYASGMSGFIGKPITIPLLIKELNNCKSKELFMKRVL